MAIHRYFLRTTTTTTVPYETLDEAKVALKQRIEDAKHQGHEVVQSNGRWVYQQPTGRVEIWIEDATGSAVLVNAPMGAER